MSATSRVGFLGLGQMGGAMAMRLVDAGVALDVFDPNPSAVEPFVRGGAVFRRSPAGVADAADVVFACLPTPAVSHAVATGPDGVIAGRRISTYVEMSTIGRPAIRAIADALGARKVSVVDAPVSGGPKGARQGTLAIMVAGPPASLHAVRPWLQIMGKTVFEIGERPGLGQAMKLVNNLIGAANMASAFEALVLGAKAGLDPDLMVRVINASTGCNSATQTKVPLAVLPGTFDYGAHLSTMYKDVKLGLAEAEELGVPMWVADAVGQLWRFAMTQGGGDDDFTTLIKYIERWAGVEVRSRPPHTP